MKPSVLIHPLASDRPTGMGNAARGLDDLLSPVQASAAPRLRRCFRWINDSLPGGAARMLVRMALVQLAPFFFPRRKLLFSSHHGPIWRTRRHAIIVHDLTALTHTRAKRLQSWYLRRLLPRVVKTASRVITISSTVAKELEAYTGVRSEVIPTYSPSIERRSAPRQRKSDLRVLVIGAHYSHKNLDLVLAAIQQARKKSGLDLRLVVAGCRDELWWRHAGGLENLRREGWLETHDYAPAGSITAWLQSALCLVYPSLAEGQGLPPLEALACGCPVLCADIPVLRETCGDAAFFFDPHHADSLAELLVAISRGERQGDIDRQRSQAPAVLARFSSAVLRKRWQEFFASWN